MKFSHRFVGLGVVLVLLIFGYFLLGDDVFPELNPRRLLRVTYHRQTGKVIQNADVCLFAERLVPIFGIHTQTLLDHVPVNDGSQPVRYAAKSKKEKPTQNLPPLRVFVIPHSHNDPGWLKTLGRYYLDQTKQILDNMVLKLTKYPDLTFVWSETVFLSMWWNDIDEVTKTQTKKLIERGQLELVTGGWVDPDEATTHYADIVDEMMEGHRWLEKHLGVKPQVYWAPDPFGYSSTMPYLVKRAGFKQMVILRIHDDVKAQLREKQNLEFFWRQTWDTADRDTDMFTHLLPYALYSIKHSCGPDPYVCLMFDFRKIPGEYSEANPPTLLENNIATYSKYLVDQFRAKASHYRQDIIFMPLGDDFRFDHSIEWEQQYSNYKILFNFINTRKDWNVNVTFGTPSEYFASLEDKENKYTRKSTILGLNTTPQYPILYGDFFPYMDRDEEFWTGFYTTRPFWKGLARELQADLRSAEILNSLACAYAQFSVVKFRTMLVNVAALDTARQSLALFQHHDAITGTSKPEVVQDYGDRLWKAKKLAQRVKLSSVAYLLSSGKVQMNMSNVEGKSNVGTYVLDVDDARSSDSPEPAKTTIPLSFDGTKVIFFNPGGHLRRQLVRLRVDSLNLLVTDHEGTTVPSQIMPIFRKLPQPVENDYHLVFYAEIPGFGLRTYIVKKVHVKLLGRYIGQGLATVSRVSSSSGDDLSWPKIDEYAKEDFLLSNKYFTALFDRNYGLLHSLKYDGHEEVDINIRFLSYKSSRSGAYLFYPQGKASDKLFTRDPNVKPSVFVTQGPLVSEVRSVWPMLVHMVRVHHSDVPQARAVDIENQLDISADATTFADQEFIMRFYTSVPNGQHFYTDLNGYQFRRRKYQSKFHIAGNYYPVTTQAYIQSNTTRVTLLTAQSHGVSSLRQGWLEVMLDRKLTYDDNRGLGEGIYDNVATTTRFSLLVEHALSTRDEENGKNSYPSLLSQELSNSLLYPISNFYQLVYDTPFVPFFSPLWSDLSCDLHVVNLKTMRSPHDAGLLEVALVLHRTGFQCQYPSSMLNCSAYSEDLTFGELFRDLRLSLVKERSLSLMYANGRLPIQPDTVIPIQPMEISTFLLTFK